MKLSNKMEIPQIGFGTWLISSRKCKTVVKEAINQGYRHIDTAQAYFNERGVGKGILESGVARDKIFVTTKVMAEFKSYKSAKKSINVSLKKLGLDYIDLVLIHSPTPWLEFRKTKKTYFKENLEVWRALEEAYAEGKVKAIGVSNFKIADLENLIKNAKIKPMVNQVLCHVGQTPFDIIDYCQKNGIVVEAYSPIAHGQADRIKIVDDLAKKYNKSFAQICLKYCLDLGLVVLPKATKIEHIKNNIDLDFNIEKEDFEKLKKAKPLSDYGKHNFFPVFKQSGK